MQRFSTTECTTTTTLKRGPISLIIMTPSIHIPLPPGVPRPPRYTTNTHNAPSPTIPTDNLIRSKTRLTLTTHNTAKNIHNLDAIILRHQQQRTNILCLQEIPTTSSLRSLLNLLTFTNISSDKSNGTAIIIHTRSMDALLPSTLLYQATTRFVSLTCTNHITLISDTD